MRYFIDESNKIETGVSLINDFVQLGMQNYKKRKSFPWIYSNEHITDRRRNIYKRKKKRLTIKTNNYWSTIYYSLY